MFQFFRTLLATALALAPDLVQGYSAPGACSGACWAHDPAVIRRADGLYFKLNTGENIEIASSSSLNGPWKLQGSALTSGSNIDSPGNKDLWPPDVSLVKSVSHLYYSVSSFGSQESAIGLATSTTLDPGSWTDNQAVGIASKAGSAYKAIDANPIKVGDTYLMNSGSVWNDTYQVKLNSAATKTGGEASCPLHNEPAQGEEYRIMMCRRESATGGFVDKDGQKCTASGGSPLLECHDEIYGPGGQGAFSDSSKGLVLYTASRETMLRCLRSCLCRLVKQSRVSEV
ncbi:glycoside hydrolase, family 43 [Diplocarpon rosae]|nr:glycoside hydrolase, family 43 [Diplocarpon rosae]